MKKIYIVLTYTGTVLARIVKFYTRKDYSHVSISLDSRLNHMYSFGRFNPYNPFIGGFVHESPNFGTFKRFRNTDSKIYSFEVTNKEYFAIKKNINKFKDNKEIYKFNVLGLFLVPLKIKRIKDYHYYCAEFVKYVLENSNLERNFNFPDIIQPNHFNNLDGFQLVYKGKLRNYLK